MTKDEIISNEGVLVEKIANTLAPVGAKWAKLAEHVKQRRRDKAVSILHAVLNDEECIGRLAALTASI